MLSRNYLEVPQEPVGEDKSIRWVIGKPEGAPNFAMRVIEFQAGAIFETHQHPYEHEIWRRDRVERSRCGPESPSTFPQTSRTATGIRELARCGSSA